MLHDEQKDRHTRQGGVLLSQEVDRGDTGEMLQPRPGTTNLWSSLSGYGGEEAEQVNVC